MSDESPSAISKQIMDNSSEVERQAYILVVVGSTPTCPTNQESSKGRTEVFGASHLGSTPSSPKLNGE